MKYAFILLLPCALSAQNVSFSLTATTLALGAAAGSASVQLVASSPTAAWTAQANASWLHLSSANSSGSGSAFIQFTYDANPNSTEQNGSLTIAGQTLSITQAGTGFVPLSMLSTVISQGLNLPYAVAVDNAGNVYIADTGNNAIEEWNASTQQMATLVSGLNAPHGVAVDTQGNIYIADSYNHQVEEWNVSTQQLTPIVTGLMFPVGVAVDGQGNVYVADLAGNQVVAWNSQQGPAALTGLNLNNPTGVAVDSLGNLYIADFKNNLVKRWSPGTSQAITIVSQGLSFPNAVTVDGQGNVYIVDGNNNAIKEWNAATQSVSTIVASGVNGSFGIAMDAQNNLYVANTGTGSILKYTAGFLTGATNLSEGAPAGSDSVPVVLGSNAPLNASSDQSWLTITSTTGGVIGFSFQTNTTLSSRVAHITALGVVITVTQSGDAPSSLLKCGGDGQSTPVGQPFATALQVCVTDAAGNALPGLGVTLTVIPGASGSSAAFAANPPMPVQTDQNGMAAAPILTANGIAGTFTVTASANGLSATFSLTNLNYALASNSVLVGSAAGSGTALLLTNGPWTAASNAPWLQIAQGSTSGAGSALIQFTYSANLNPGPQTGTLSIAGFTFTVTQAGAGYVPITVMNALVTSGLSNPQAVAVDGQGNVYIADTGNGVIKEWRPGAPQPVVAVSGLVSPSAVAVDGQGNIYIADSGNHAIDEFSPANQQLNTLVSGLGNPLGVAVDGQGNVYFSDAGNNAVEEWISATQQVTILADSGLMNPGGVAVDGQGNVYFADSGNNAVKEWAVAGSGQVTAVVSAGLSGPVSVAVDGQENLYIADTGDHAIQEWNAASQQMAAVVSSGISAPMGVAVDMQGSIYVADSNNNAVEKFTLAYLALGAASLNESSQAGSDSVTAQVLPANIPLTAVSDQSWLTVTGTASGVISFSYQLNTTGGIRTAHITVLGVPVTVTQSGDVPANLTQCGGNGQTTLSGQPFATSLQVCAVDAGGNPLAGWPVIFSVNPGASGAAGIFSASPAMPVLTNASGTATAPALTANGIEGTFTVNASVNGLTAVFSLTNLGYALASSSVLVGSAAGSGAVLLVTNGPWTAASNAAWLQTGPGSSSGNGSALIEFNYSTNSSPAIQTGTLTVAGLTFTVTQAGAGYVPVTAATTLVSSGLNKPEGVAVDGQGNVYVADSANNAIKEWSPGATQAVVKVSGLNNPNAVAVDAQGNLYIADSGNHAIE